MLSLHSCSNSKFAIIFLFVGLLSFGSMVTAKPSWKDGGSTEQPTKGSGKGGGKNKTATTISDITIIEHPISLSIMSGEKATFIVSANSSDGQEIIYRMLRVKNVDPVTEVLEDKVGVLQYLMA